MPLGNHPPHQLRIGLGPEAGHAEGRFDPLVAEKIEDFGGVAGVGAGIEGQRDLEAAVRAPLDDRAQPRAGIGRRWRPHGVCGRCGSIIVRASPVSEGSETGVRPCRDILRERRGVGRRENLGRGGIERRSAAETSVVVSTAAG